MAPLLPVVVLLVSAVMWGVTWMPLRWLGALGIGGPQLSAVAFGAAALLLLPTALRQRQRWRARPWLVPAMMLLGGFANFAFTLALIDGEVIRVMMLFYLAPVWGVLGGRVFLGERLGARRLLGLLLALAGAFLVLGGPALFDAAPSINDLLALGAGFSFAMNNVACRAAQEVPLASKLAAMFLGCAALAGAYLVIGGLELPSLAASGWGWLLGYGLLWIVVATLATQWAVTHMEAGRASIILIAELVAAVASAAWFGGERMAAPEVIGGSLILLATLMEAWRPAPRGLPAPAVPQ